MHARHDDSDPFTVFRDVKYIGCGAIGMIMNQLCDSRFGGRRLCLIFRTLPRVITIKRAPKGPCKGAPSGSP